MNWNDLTMWVITFMVLTLTGVLYVRVNIHDWGMIGFTIALFGISVLMVRWVLRSYGWMHGTDELVFVWRLLVLIGAPIALAGWIAGIWRDPPPLRQVVTRLGALALVVGGGAFMMAVM